MRTHSWHPQRTNKPHRMNKKVIMDDPTCNIFDRSDGGYHATAAGRLSMGKGFHVRAKDGRRRTRMTTSRYFNI